MVESELGLAERIAADYRHRGIDEDDLRQVAFLALVKAADRYDDAHGTRFPVFASVTINGEIKRHFRDHGWSVRPPRSIQERALTVRDAQEALSQQLQRPPTVAELAERCNLDQDEVLLALDAQAGYRAKSIGQPVTGGDAPPTWEPVDEEAGFARVTDQLDFEHLLVGLSERDRRIVELRFCDRLSQSAIADEIGLSQVQISRILSGITARLREELDPDEGAVLAAG